MGGCQNYGPFLDPYYNTAPNIYGTQKGTIILTTTHVRATVIILLKPLQVVSPRLALLPRWHFRITYDFPLFLGVLGNNLYFLLIIIPRNKEACFFAMVPSSPMSCGLREALHT